MTIKPRYRWSYARRRWEIWSEGWGPTRGWLHSSPFLYPPMPHLNGGWG